MFTSLTVSWLFTIVFVATGAYSLVRFARITAGSDGQGDALAELSHLLMSLAMIAMTWAWSGGRGTASGIVQLVLFGLLALWFLGRAVLPRVHGRIGNAYHLAMAAAMVWMVAAMASSMGATDSGSGGHDGHGGTAGASVMPDMAGMTGGPLPVWVVVVSVGFVVVLAAFAALWATRAVRPPSAEGRVARWFRLDAACHLLMSLGMGGMVLAML